jgi:hypothetical protein
LANDPSDYSAPLRTPLRNADNPTWNDLACVLSTPTSSDPAAGGKELVTMISLKKYMDLDADELNKHLKPPPDDLLS